MREVGDQGPAQSNQGIVPMAAFLHGECDLEGIVADGRAYGLVVVEDELASGLVTLAREEGGLIVAVEVDPVVSAAEHGAFLELLHDVRLARGGGQGR